MSVKIVRKMILVALVLIVFANVSDWAGQWLRTSAGIVWGLAAAIAAFYCRIRASRSIATNKKYLLWMAVPGLLACIPIVHQVYRFFKTEDRSWLLRLWDVSPIIIGFIAPVILLWMAYSCLEKHSEKPTNGDKSLSGLK